MQIHILIIILVYFSFSDTFTDIGYLDKTKTAIFQSLSCSGCSKVYRTQFALKRHKLYECGVEKQFACHICVTSFYHNFDLNRHLRNVHYVKDSEIIRRDRRKN